MIEAELLNADGHAAGLSRAALRQAIQAQGEAWHGLVTERCPHLFADVPVFITVAQMQQMREVIDALERVVGLPGWTNGVHFHAPLPNPDGTTDETTSHPTKQPEDGCQVVGYSHSTKPASGQVAGYLPPAGEGTIVASSAQNNKTLGVFFGYDFHLNADGAHLIEINSNAGGGFLNALLLDSQRDAALPGVAVAEENLEKTFLDMFRNEWRLARGDTPLNCIAIVDEQPEAQYLYPEFLLAQHMFERAGIAAYIADPAVLHSRGEGLYLESSGDDRKIDLVYNRLTDFSLQQHSVLRQAYLDGGVVLTPDPMHYARYADKRNLMRLTDADGLRALGASDADIATLRLGVPHTLMVRPELEEMLWRERKQWFFKPATGYGSKGAYRGANLTRRVFGEIMQGGYVAQHMAAPGERMVCAEAAEAQPLKYDVRCYVYAAQVQLVAARLYQGQTTNFRTPGGGFAPVRVLG